MAGAAVFFGWQGPAWYQRVNHPLAYVDVIAREAAAEHLDPYMVAALINVESKFRPDALSSVGAVGLMQVRPSTALEVGLGSDSTARSLRVPGTNIRVGVRYLAYLLRRYGGNQQLALAAYNAGMTNVDTWVARARKAGTPFRGSIAFPATAHYVDDVAAQTKVYRELYPDAFPVK